MSVLRRLRAALDTPSDAELIARFAAERDAGAFELLVWRYAGLVLRTCRGVLRDHHAAEDAAQAAFLALARQAGSVRESLAGWLFRVARRVAARAARQQGKCPAVANTDLDRLPATPHVGPDPELDRVLHEELARLPEKYRDPVLLCFFDGLTHTEAAHRLGWPVGTVAGRVARAKDLLARGLTRRGVAPAALAAATVVVPPSFAGVTARAAAAYVGRGVPQVPRTVLELTKQEVRAMAANKALRVVGILSVCGVLALGVAWATERGPQPEAVIGSPGQPPAGPPAVAAQPPKPVFGKTHVVAPMTTDLHWRLIWGGGPSSAAVVLVDGSDLFRDPKALDFDALDLERIQTALSAFQPDPDHNRKGVHFEVHYGPSRETHPTGMRLLQCGLEGVGRRTGFTFSIARETHHIGKFDWDGLVAPLREAGKDGAETRVGDERAHAYPVRTALSRVLAGPADAVVDVRGRLDPREEVWVPADLEKSALEAIAALKLPKGGKLVFLFAVAGRDDRTAERLRELGKQWAGAHGLELLSYRF